jgi:putative membrane protein
MFRILANWLLSAISLLIVSYFVSGFEVAGIGSALFAVVVIGFVNATLGLFLKIVTFPLTLMSLGVFWFVINAIMLEFSAAFVPGFHIRGFFPAFLGAIVLSIVNLLLKGLTREVRD